MGNKIDVNLLSKEVMEYLENYVEDIEEQVEIVTNEVGKDAVKELKEKSPHGKGKRNKPYYKGWRIKKDRKVANEYRIKIHNSTNYQLTHLLEFGHATVNGGHTKAIPHIRPIEEKYKKIFEEKIKKAIRRESL